MTIRPSCNGFHWHSPSMHVRTTYGYSTTLKFHYNFKNFDSYAHAYSHFRSAFAALYE